MTEEAKLPFETYKAFATVVFESGAYENVPSHLGPEEWDVYLASFAALAFDEGVLQRDIAGYIGVTAEAIRSRRVATEAHLLKFIPEEAKATFTPEVLHDAFPTRMGSQGRRRSIARKHGGSTATIVEGMERGRTYGEVIADLPINETVSLSNIRTRVKALGYSVPKSSHENFQARKAEIENPEASVADLQRFYSEMSKSYRDRLTRGDDSTLVSFARTLKDLGAITSTTSRAVLELLEPKLLSKEIVIGQVPLMIKMKDGTYRHQATYHLHRRIDTPKIKAQEDFIRNCIAEWKEENK